MLGGIPNFGKGAAVAMIMLLPSIVSIFLLQFLEKYNIRYKKISGAELTKNRLRDVIWSGLSVLFLVTDAFDLCGDLCGSIRDRLAE